MKIMIEVLQEVKDQITVKGIKIFLETDLYNKMKKILILIFQILLVKKMRKRKFEKIQAKRIYLTDIMSNLVNVKRNQVKTQYYKKKLDLLNKKPKMF